MATKIVTKNSSTASAVPTASDLVQGELAVNVADKRLFTEDNAGAIVELGTNPYNFTANHNGSAKLATTSTGIDVTGTVDTSLDLLVGGAVAGNAGTRTINVGTAGSVAGGIQIWAANNQSSFLQFGDDSTTSANHYRGFLSYNHSTDTLALGASGSTKVSVNSTGIDVTGTATVVGTTTSGILLKSSSGASSGFKLYNDSGTDTAHLNNHFSGSMVFSTNNTERMRIDSSGHTMFATTDTAPGAGNTNTGISLRGGADNRSFLSTSNHYTMHLNRNTSDGEILYFAKDGTAVGSIGTNAATMYVSAPQAGGMKYSYLNSTNAVMLPVTTTGASANGTHDLGLSTARFRDLYITGLDVTYSTYNKISSYFSGSYISGFKFSDLNGGIWYDAGTDDLTVSASHANSQLILESGGSESMRIDASGRLLVGYTAADGVGGAPSDNNFSELGKGYINLNRDDTATARQVQFGKNGVVAGYIQTAGSTTSYVTSSDQRLKENIADADDAGSKVDAIQVRKYDWKADGSHQDYGMIAQELQAVAPEAVSGDADSEEMMGVDYSKLVPMLIKEIQSLRNRVAQLEE